MQEIIFLLLGVCIIVFSVINLKENANTVYWYNRTKVKEKDLKKYAKTIGLGSLIMGISFSVTAILQMILHLENLYYISLCGLIIGLIIMLYAQFKYNKGIF